MTTSSSQDSYFLPISFAIIKPKRRTLGFFVGDSAQLPRMPKASTG